MRSQVIHGLMRKIRFEGHIGTFVGELAVVYFTGIKHTADWYLASFKENEVASCRYFLWLYFPDAYSCFCASIHRLDQAPNRRLL